MVLVRELAHVDVAAAEAQCCLDRLPLVLDGGTGQVEVQAVLPAFPVAAATNRSPTCMSSPGQQRAG